MTLLQGYLPFGEADTPDESSIQEKVVQPSEKVEDLRTQTAKKALSLIDKMEEANEIEDPEKRKKRLLYLFASAGWLRPDQIGREWLQMSRREKGIYGTIHGYVDSLRGYVMCLLEDVAEGKAPHVKAADYSLQRRNAAHAKGYAEKNREQNKNGRH